jgi:glucosamine-6-phosphate deaminase
MRICRCPSKQQLALDAALAGAGHIRRAIHEKGEATIVLATGMSQAAMLSHLVRENLDWSRVTAFHLDEYVGIRASHPASFRRYLQQRFLSKVKLRKFHAITGEKNPLSECKVLNALIRDVDIDVAFVGIGENAHLAFNDPPANVATDSPYIVVKLDAACRRQQVGEGWFKILSEVPTQAISMSIRQILKAKHIVCAVPDARKAKAVQASLEGDVTPKVPASYLQEHPRAVVYVDPESGALLGPSRDPIVLELAKLEEFRYKAAQDHDYHLFIAADFTRIPESSLRAFARKALEGGAVTMTAWGKGASIMELILDHEAVSHFHRSKREENDENSILTGSHRPEDLEKALFFYLDNLRPSPVYELTCDAAVAVVAGTVPKRELLLESLQHPGEFIDRYVGAEDDEESQ